ncbi:hypothetical protein CKO28_24105 [Rhodovibrio sodomensis]|uniref:Uncharacterized protein n=1 Tax=Rhodovibrio sodomensis TaxID=1088 RepID=A0ABS1DKP7_9PROT|nr:hypothetical protein [Rhodovibrio sodomensis]MBK1671095.1 hypothetical protein [Rhodovibrio sodomensis]
MADWPKPTNRQPERSVSNGAESRPDWRHPHDLPENVNELPPDDQAQAIMELVRVLHVHGQDAPHDAVLLSGNRPGLTVLRDAIGAVLARGDGASAETHETAWDGEDYRVIVARDDAPFGVDPMSDRHGGPPYMDPIHNPRRSGAR